MVLASDGACALGSAPACSCQASGTLETVGAARPKRRLDNIHWLQALDMAQASDLAPPSHMAHTTGPGIQEAEVSGTVQTSDVAWASSWRRHPHVLAIGYGPGIGCESAIGHMAQALPWFRRGLCIGFDSGARYSVHLDHGSHTVPLVLPHKR